MSQPGLPSGRTPWCSMGMSDPTDAELVHRYRPHLLAEQAELTKAGRESGIDRKPVVLDQQSVGRLSRMDAMQGQAMAKAVQVRRDGRGRAIEAALARMQDGEFGWCDSCGDFIGLGRLDLDPTLVRCRDCAG